MEKKHNKVFAFGRMNFILLGISVAIILVGMILMSGSGSDTTGFNPDIFSTRRIRIAPLVCLVGYLLMIYAIVHRTRKEEGKE